MFRVKCKDERKRRNDRLGEGGSIFPYIKNTKVFLENLPIFSENTKVFLKNTKVFLQQESVSKRNRPIPSSAVGAGFACPKTQSKLFSGEQTSPLRTKRQHYPHFEFNCKVCTYASGYTYGGISLHVYTHQVTRIYVSSYTYVRMSLHVTYTENGCYFSRLVTKYVVIFSYSLLNRLSIFAFSN